MKVEHILFCQVHNIQIFTFSLQSQINCLIFLDFCHDPFFLRGFSSESLLLHLYQDNIFFFFRPKFGKVITLLDKNQFLDAIDKENPNVIVVVHLYSEVMLL